MTATVVKTDISATRALELQAELRRDGLVRGIDYDWMYFNAPLKKVVFTFYTQEYSLLYALKWS